MECTIYESTYNHTLKINNITNKNKNIKNIEELYNTILIEYNMIKNTVKFSIIIEYVIIAIKDINIRLFYNECVYDTHTYDINNIRLDINDIYYNAIIINDKDKLINILNDLFATNKDNNNKQKLWRIIIFIIFVLLIASNIYFALKK